MTALGKELQSGDDEYANLPAKEWHRGPNSKRRTIKDRVRQLSVRPSARHAKPARLMAADNATDNV